MSFDIKAEAHIWINAILHAASRTPWKQDQLEALLARCHDAAVRETEEADIKAVCSACAGGNKPRYEAKYLGWYHFYTELKKHACKAHYFHERRRRKERG